MDYLDHSHYLRSRRRRMESSSITGIHNYCTLYTCTFIHVKCHLTCQRECDTAHCGHTVIGLTGVVSIIISNTFVNGEYRCHHSVISAAPDPDMRRVIEQSVSILEPCHNRSRAAVGSAVCPNNSPQLHIVDFTVVDKQYIR